MKRLNLALMALATFAGIGGSIAATRSITVHYKKVSATKFQKITSYDATKCISASSTCTYLFQTVGAPAPLVVTSGAVVTFATINNQPDPNGASRTYTGTL